MSEPLTLSLEPATDWTAARIAAANAELDGATPQETLRWSIDRFPGEITLACSFGGLSGMVLLDMVMRLDRSIPVFYLDTDLLFPETLATRDAAIARYDFQPLGFRAERTLDQQAAAHGPALWARDPDACCALRKVAPNRRALEGHSAWISGLRRDQSAARRDVQRVGWDVEFGLVKINPLVDWTENQLWDYVNENQVPHNPLHAQGYPSIGCIPCTRPVAAGEDARAGRWTGFEKTECGLHSRSLGVSGAGR